MGNFHVEWAGDCAIIITELLEDGEMKLSEPQAHQRWCPYRDEKAKCLASGCMAWIWMHNDPGTISGSDHHAYATVGYCGRVGG